MTRDRLLGLAPRALATLRHWRLIAWLKARLEVAQGAPRAAGEESGGDDVFAAWRGAVG